MVRPQRNLPSGSPRVLEYESPEPPRTTIQVLRDELDRWINAAGGPNWFLLILSLTCIDLALLCRNIVGVALFFVAFGIWVYLVDRWSKSSRWF